MFPLFSKPLNQLVYADVLELIGASASDYFRLFGLTALAFMWARMATVALAASSGQEFRGHGRNRGWWSRSGSMIRGLRSISPNRP